MTRTLFVVESSSAMLFDGSVADAWEIQMVGSVFSARTRLISPGRLYTFIIRQNDRGDHAFHWPTTCLNAAALNYQPNAITVQNFIGMTGGLLYANIPGATL